MRILNVRLGFAANSSSTHSFIFLPDAQDGVAGSDGSPQGFGWGFWTAASNEKKLGWLGQVVRQNLKSALGERTALLVAAHLVRSPIDSEGYVDHQSVPTLPRDWSGKGLDLDFLADLRAYLLRDDLVILGGHDNTEGNEGHSLQGQGPSPGELPFLDGGTANGRDALVARKDGPIWTLFNRHTGAKVRLTFEGATFTPAISTWRPQAPELVDLKITDACNAGCAYCYQGSTSKGKHGSEDLIAAIPSVLGKAHVFEVALGGGEPTIYPKFHRLLQSFRYAGIVPNFTTRKLNWLTGPHADEIAESMGTFGYSVDYRHEVIALHTAIVKADLAREKWPTVHYIVGCGTEYDFRQVVKMCDALGFDLTLLGYKENGRGAGNKKGGDADYDWLSIVKDAGLYDLRIDTALALKDLKRLQDAGIPEETYTVEEGRFSWYIDAVTQMAGPSSYCPPDQMVSIKSKNPAVEALVAFARFVENKR